MKWVDITTKRSGEHSGPTLESVRRSDLQKGKTVLLTETEQQPEVIYQDKKKNTKPHQKLMNIILLLEEWGKGSVKNIGALLPSSSR